MIKNIKAILQVTLQIMAAAIVLLIYVLYKNTIAKVIKKFKPKKKSKK